MKREDFSVMIFPFGYDMMKEVDVTGILHEGINELEVCVVGNLFNRMQKDTCIPGTPIPMPYTPKPYGIRETEGKRCVLREIR